MFLLIFFAVLAAVAFISPVWAILLVAVMILLVGLMAINKRFE